MVGFDFFRGCVMDRVEASSFQSDSISSSTHSTPHFDLDDPADAAAARLHAQAAELKMAPGDLEAFLKNGFEVGKIPAHPAMRRTMARYLKKNETSPPKWMVTSGLFPEFGLDLAERRKRIRILYKAAVLIIRRELKRHEVDAFKAERSIFWDPVAEVCQTLEIAPSKLSAFCKELTGNSLIQVIDSVRAERLKRKLRAGVKKFLVSSSQSLVSSSEPGAHGACLGTGMGDRWAVWKALKTNRRWPEFSQNSWAQELGFSSYRRLYRACQVVYGATPHQLEMGLIGECLETAEDRGQMTEDRAEEISLEEAERVVREIRADEWMEGRRE